MGASGSTAIQVNFNHPNSFYYAGEQVTGEISFQNPEEKLKIDSIYLECIGEMGYTTQETRRIYVNQGTGGYTRTEVHTHNHAVPFLNIHIPLLQPQYGQDEITLSRGQYSWPFTFVLQENLPPSTIPRTTSYPYVKNYTRIVLDKPWYKPNTKQVFPLIVFPHVNILHIPNGQQSVDFQNENRKKMCLQGHLIRAVVVPGDRLYVQIDLQNPKGSVIKKIVATLYQHRTVRDTSRSETIFQFDLPELRDFDGTHFQRTIDLPFPEGLFSPTYMYMTQTKHSSVNISVNYELVLDVKARGFFTDFKLNVPVIVGTEPISTEQQQSIYPPIPLANDPSMYYDQSPPNYETIYPDIKM